MALFNFPFCKNNYLDKRQPAIVTGMLNVPDIPIYLEKLSPTQPATPPPITALSTDRYRPQIISLKLKIRALNIYIIKAALYYLLNKRTNYEYFIISLRDIDKALEVKKEIDFIIILPAKYYNFFDIFLRKESD